MPLRFLTIRNPDGAPVATVDLETNAFCNHLTNKRGVLYSAYYGQGGRAHLHNEQHQSTWSKFIASHLKKKEQRRFSFFQLGHTVQISYKHPNGRVSKCRFTTVKPMLPKEEEEEREGSITPPLEDKDT